MLMLSPALPTRLAEPVTLHRLGEDHGGLALLLRRRRVGRVDLLRVVAAALEPPDLLVGHVGDHLGGLRVLPEEVLPGVGPALGLVVLVVAVEGLLHALEEHALLVLREQAVPALAPDHLDHVPAGAAEAALQLLDDLGVAAHGAVQALEVAVHHEDQVVELLAGGQGDGAQRLGLVHLPVAHEGPDLAPRVVDEAARLQVLHEARLVDRHQRREAHGDGGKLPEVRHEPGVRIGGEAATIHLAAEASQLLLAQAPLQEGPRVDARRCVALEVDEVAGGAFVLGAEEVVEAHLEQRGHRLVGGEVTAELLAQVVGPDDHGQRVPAIDAADAVLEARLPGLLLLVALADRVHVGRGGLVGKVRARAAHLVDEPLDQVVGAVDALLLENRVEGVEPFPCLLGIDVVLVRHALSWMRRRG
jgi:hypothetical protein